MKVNYIKLKMTTNSLYYESFDIIDVKNANMLKKYYLHIAAKIALLSDMNQKHGAIIVFNNTILSSGYNYLINQNKQNKQNNQNTQTHQNPISYSIHAEVSAILSLKNKQILSKCDLYILRISIP